MTDNELIAEFMKLDKHPNNQRAYWVEDQDCYLTFDNLQFHKSWNQLMPVVEKIASIPAREFNYDVTKMTQLRLNKDQILTLPIICPIDVLYKKIIDFLKWYNQQKA